MSRPSRTDGAGARRCAASTVRSKSIDVPAGQHVGIERCDASQNASSAANSSAQRVAFSGIGALAAVDDQDFVDARRIQRDREQAFALRVGLDVERQHARLDPRRRRAAAPDCRRSRDAAAANRLAFDLATALDAALDQIAHREAHVGFERVDAGRVQPVAQRGTSAGASTSRRHTGAPRRCACPRLAGARQAPRALGVVGTDVEVRALPIIAHQERAAVFQSAIEMDDGRRAPAGSVTMR